MSASGYAVNPGEQTISPPCHSGGPANSSSICPWRLLRHATFECERELLEPLDVEVRLYARRHQPRRVAAARLPVYPEGATEPVWARETAQSFQVSQYCHMALGW